MPDTILFIYYKYPSLILWLRRNFIISFSDSNSGSGSSDTFGSVSFGLNKGTDVGDETNGLETDEGVLGGTDGPAVEDSELAALNDSILGACSQ